MTTIHVNDEGVFMVGDRPIPWAQMHSNDVVVPGIHHRTRQAFVHFENGWHLSIVWGSGTYSTNRDTFSLPRFHEFTEEPTTVEVAIINERTGQWAPDGDVLGWVSADRLLRIIAAVAEWPSGSAGAIPEDDA